MFNQTCTYRECGKSFSKPTQTGAAQALRMHISRVHTKTMKSATKTGGNWRGRYPAITAGEPEQRVKRAYTRRKKQIEPQSISFCPRCGCDINKVALAMAVADNMNGK